MATYPQSGTDYPRTELLLNGTWTDITTYVRGPGGTSGITINRGRADAQSRISAQTSTFTLDNTGKQFSSRNPSSPYYGLLRNAQIRHSAGAVTNESYLWEAYDDQSAYDEARTADKAVLDITGDLEIRVDLWPHTWRPDSTGSGVTAMLIATKYAFDGVSQRSWALYVRTDGKLSLAWSPDGTLGARITSTSTSAVPATSGRLSIKVTLDVNNGAAGNDVKFYTASSIDGSYTQLGSTVTTAGVTSVFSSTADLCIGTGSDSPTINFGGSALAYGGKIYEFRLYNGIGGTLVANPKFYAQTPGTTSFSDGLGTPNTWAINNGARLTSDRYRFHGELVSIPQAWDVTGREVYVQAQAAGMLRRLALPGSPLRSPMYRQFVQYGNVTGYWPMEDENGATSIASAVGGQAGQISSCTTGSSASGTGGLPGTAQVTAFTSATSALNFSANTTVTDTGTLSLMLFMKISAMPAAQKSFMVFYTSGTARQIWVGLDATNWRIDFYAADSTNLSSSTTAAATILPTQWIGLNLLIEQNGANVDWSARWLVVGEGSVFSGIGPTSFAGTVGRATQVRLVANSQYTDAQFGHLLLANDDIGFVSTTISDASNAYAGETAATRIDRLCEEEGVDIDVIGMWSLSAPVGYQATASLAELLYACADTDLGVLYEARDKLALQYRTRGDIEARRDVDLVYTDSVLSATPVPVEDDRDIANDITVSRTSGSSFRYIVTDGPLGTAEVGAYQRSWTANAYSDDQLEDVAGRLIGLGTWDEARIPNLAVSLNRSQIADGGHLFGQVMALDAGDTAALTDLPQPMPPDDVLLLVQGYTEMLSRYLWDLTFNVTPAKPLQTGVYDYANIVDYARYDTSGSTLNTTINSSATTIILDSTDTDDTWTTTSGSYPFDIMIEGERITLNNAPGATSPQTFTGCTRSVNGVSKAHTAGAAASLAEPFFYG